MTGFINDYEARYGDNVVASHTSIGQSRMHRLDQPAGHYVTQNDGGLALSIALNSGFGAMLDLGCGRFGASRWRRHSFAVIPPLKTANSFELDGRLDALNIAFSSPLYQRSLDAAGIGREQHWFEPLASGPVEDAMITTTARTLWDDFVARRESQQLFFETGASLMIAQLFRLARFGGRDVHIARGGLSSWAERRCREYLHERLAEEVSLADLAAVANLSPFHFARMFKQSTGLPPHAYQRRLRAERACELLGDARLSIADVALAVGYQTPQAFTRMFREEIGCTPTAWRARIAD